MCSPKKSVRPMSDGELAEALYYFEAKRARKEALELLALVKPSGAARSHIIADADDLKGYKHWIYRAADEERREFFIELGKLLEAKRLKPNAWSKLDEDVAFILCLNPKIKSTEAVQLLKNFGHSAEMSPLAFKQKRYNWIRAARKTRQLWEKAGWKYHGNGFLDDATRNKTRHTVRYLLPQTENGAPQPQAET
jgi:hypothetical protein